MPGPRQFLIAPSLARLLRREGGMEHRVVEGHFPSRPGRAHFVSVEPGRAELVLSEASLDCEVSPEEWTALPHAHSMALLDVAAGKVGFERTRLRLGSGREIVLERILHPATLDVVTVLPGDRPDGEAAAPAWCGPEVTDDPAWEKRSIALQGAPAKPEVPLSNAALDALLSDLENGQPLRVRPESYEDRANRRMRSMTEAA